MAVIPLASFEDPAMKRQFSLPALANPAPPCFGPDKPWLAPLAGYSDLPFRLLCAGFGAATCVTEMVSAKGLCHQSAGTDNLLENAMAESPLIVQLFGSEPECMSQAAKILLEKGWLWFDCNLGCPAKKVLRQGAGAALLADIGKALEIAQAMIAALKCTPREGPKPKIGFKLRLGISPEKPVLKELALRLQDAGADWLTVHPRFASDGYFGHARWEEIANLKPLLEIPLIASGDLLSAEKGLECLAATGATGIMYARGALRDPLIFSRHLALQAGVRLPPQTREQLRSLIERHIKLTRDWSGLEKAFYKIRSIIPRYVRHLPGVGQLRQSLSSCTSWDALFQALDNFMERER